MIDQFISKIGDLFINYIHWPYLGMCILVTWLVIFLLPAKASDMGTRAKVLLSMVVAFVLAIVFILGFLFFDKTEQPALFTQRLALSLLCVPFAYNWLVEPWLGKWEKKVLK